MRALLFFLGLFPLVSLAGWVEGNVFGTRDDNSRTPTVIFTNTYTGIGAADEGKWIRVPVSNFGIPSDAKAVFLSGILIITHGTTPQTCDLTISTRAFGDTMSEDFYIGQVIEASSGNGQRSTMATWVPVKNGQFEYFWKRSTHGQWPSECAYGINLTLQAYIR